MRFTSASGIALAVVAWAWASHPRVQATPALVEELQADDGTQPQVPASGPDFSREVQLIEEARAAVTSVDLTVARDKAKEALELLLARPEGDQEARWVELVTDAGVAAWNAQDPGAARLAMEKVLEVRLRTLPDEHLDVQIARGGLANTLMVLGDLAGARALQEKVLEVRLRALPDDHPHVQKARRDLAITLRMMGELSAARALQEKVLEIRTRTLPEDHPDLLADRTSLSNTLALLGDLKGARALQEEILRVCARTMPDDHPDLQRSRGNLANTLWTLGDRTTARILQERVFEVYSRTLPDGHPDLQYARRNLAGTLCALGDFAAARALQEKVLEGLSRTLPDEHPDLQAARASLAHTLLSQGDLASARALQEKVAEVFSNTHSDEHAETQAARLNLSGTLRALGELAAARELQEKAVEFFSRTLPEDHPNLQAARANLAATLSLQGNPAAARTLLEIVLEIWLRTLPEDHPDLQAVRGNLALIIAAERAAKTVVIGEKNGQEDENRSEFLRLATAFARAIASSARAAVHEASSREAEERCASIAGDLGRAISFAEGLGVFGSDAQLEREAFVLSEEARGAALASACLSRRARADQRQDTLSKAMQSASEELARLAQAGAIADEIDHARRARDTLERELAQLARELSGAGPASIEIDPAALAAMLTEHDALVAYRRYAHSAYESGGGAEGRTPDHLCAFVLRSGNRLELIKLGPIEPIEQAVCRLRQAIGVGSGRGVGVGNARTMSGEALLTEGRVVRRLVFDPLLPLLEGTDHIVIAPDDILHVVPLDALPLEQSLLGDRWRIEMRSTLAELLRKAPVASGGTLVALGGAAFGSIPLPYAADESESDGEQHATPVEASSLLRGGAWEEGFAQLTQTGPEAVGIAALHREGFGKAAPDFVLEKRKASRAALVELAPKARFLHVATHGWFAPESVRSIADPEPLDKLMGFGTRMSGEERARGMSPMLLCGLALAGANLPEDELGRAPGLITAEEISTLDLSGCELAVLSACDTNVGERRAGQGVASLQKALHMAGARTVITSLWKVPDEATRELMLDFYRRIWIEKKPKGIALWEAKMKIRDAKDERGKLLYSTRDWAAWVLTGDPN